MCVCVCVCVCFSLSVSRRCVDLCVCVMIMLPLLEHSECVNTDCHDEAKKIITDLMFICDLKERLDLKFSVKRFGA